jgi:photosystem II stability/assembly factor-like uncharacterized protein
LNVNSGYYLFAGYAYGRDTTLFSSTDKGQSWAPYGLSSDVGQVWGIASIGGALAGVSDNRTPWLIRGDGVLVKGEIKGSPHTQLSLIALSTSSLAQASASEYYETTDGLTYTSKPSVYTDRTCNFFDFAESPRGTLYFRYDTTLLVSNDAGLSFKAQSGFLSGARYYSTIYGKAFDSSGACYFAGDFGLKRSTDEGKSWTRLCIPAVEVKTVGASLDGVLFVKPNTTSTFFFSKDEAKSWKETELPDSSYTSDAFFGSTASSTALATEYGDAYYGPCQLYEFDPAIDQWKKLTPLFPTDGTPFFSQSDTKGNIYLGNFYVSHDRGISWDKTPYPGTVPWPGFTATREGYVFEGSSQPVIYRSGDAGLSWQKFYLGAADRATAVAFASIGGGIIFAATDHNQVLRSMDNGVSWRPWTNGFNDSAVAMVVTKEGEVFVGGRAGLHYCKLNETQWHDVDLGVANHEVHSVIVHNGTDLYVGTASDGVFVSRASESGVAESAGSSTTLLSANSPNPFVRETHFTVSLAARENISLEVYDAIGRRVASLVNGQLSAGEHSFAFSTASTAGVYYAVLKTSSGVQTIKMVQAGE